MNQEYLELQGVIKEGSVITDIKEGDNRRYFKVDGYQFVTYGSHVINDRSPMYNSKAMDFFAKMANDSETIERQRVKAEESNKQIDLFMTYRKELLITAFNMAVVLLATKGEEVFMDFVDFHFDIMENDNNCQKLLSMIKQEKNKNNELG